MKKQKLCPLTRLQLINLIIKKTNSLIIKKTNSAIAAANNYIDPSYIAKARKEK
jgi:hypothetical protein